MGLHEAVDDGAGACSTCGRPTATYSTGFQHRRGRVLGRAQAARAKPIRSGRAATSVGVFARCIASPF